MIPDDFDRDLVYIRKFLVFGTLPLVGFALGMQLLGVPGYGLVFLVGSNLVIAGVLLRREWAMGVLGESSVLLEKESGLQRAPRTVDTIRNVAEVRAAIHEAGHVVCAWFNPWCTRIKSVTIDNKSLGEGEVLWNYTSSDDPSFLWYSLVVDLGGIAAEAVHLNRMRSGMSRPDLGRAKVAAEKLEELGVDVPPWGLDELEAAQLEVEDITDGVDGGGFRVETMFREGSVSPVAARAMNLAYQRAKFLIRREGSRFDKLVDAIAVDGTLDTQGVEKVFGSRPKLFREWRLK